jgi:erythromycin esterase-like protein
MRAHLTWYQDQDDKQPFIRHAHEVHDLVEALPHRPGDDGHAVALQHARQIVAYYEGFALPYLESFPFRDARAAQSLRWWYRHSGDKVVYWAASPHTANAPDQFVVAPPGPNVGWPSVGSYLRQWFGRSYLSIGFTFDHGTTVGETGETVTMPAPAPDWFEARFASVRAEQFSLDLRAPSAVPVQRWLRAPVKTRGLAELGQVSYFTGGSLAQWFDVIIHRQLVTPVRPLAPADR